ncbi:MAG: Glycine reductase complex component B subunit gamma [Syntrophorhabdus sp. PtaU1.Bin050]|nr:MAG: Glycine reductase complex component B subunit gamma [Syntrophorhabdus sp. PtaU1.Bin050]
MAKRMKIVHYLNQFFGQIGAEDKAGTQPLVKTGPVGPGVLFQELFGPEAEIVATVICGDNYFAEHIDEATDKILAMIVNYSPDLVLAGPAFNAGRYGIACGALCAAVVSRLGIPAVTGMFPENPGVESFRKTIYIVETKGTIAGMRDGAVKITRLALKLAKGKPIGSPEEEGYLPRGIRKNYFAPETGASRAVTMLLKKLKGESFQTEYPMPFFDRVAPLPPVEGISGITLALITSGGIVPKGNPDRVEASSATKYGKYNISGLQRLTAESHETTHGGYDPTYANADPNRVLPLDVMRDLEREGAIGRLYPYYYATVGNGTSVARAGQFAREIAKDLISNDVGAVIITST